MSQEDRTLEEMANAEVVPELSGPEQYYLRFGADDYGFVSKTERNQALVETDLLSEAEDTISFTGRDGETVLFDADFTADEYTITVDGDERIVPSDYEGDTLAAVRTEDGERLAELHAQIVSTQVRRDVVGEYLERYVISENNALEAMNVGDNAPRVEVTREGWVIDDTFLVQWDGDNYLVNDIQVHVRDGNRTVAADESKQAREFSFEAIDGPASVEAPDGDVYELDEREQRFLASVEALLTPHTYLGEEAARDVEDMRQFNDDTLSAIAASANCQTFTDETDGLHHNHGLQKHRLQDLGVTDEAVERLHHRGDGHSGVHELALRENEFRNADFEVFDDAPNNAPYKWRKINNTREDAPIPERVRRNLNEMFG